MAGFYPDENDPLRRGFAGRMTWFNPKPWTYNDPATGRVWTDAQAQARREGAHASGLPINTPGFATAGREGLGHWYEVTLPDGRKYVTQKTDIGPTGVVDINAALASNAYPGGPETMPGGKASARYLGSKLPEGMTAGASNAPVTDMPFHRESSDSEDTAIASGPPQGRKMPEQPRSLMDMFQPTNALGEPTSFDQAIRDRSGSLIGMGMGLLNARGPGFGDALQGYMVGAQQDAQQGARRAQLQHQKSQEGRQAREDAFARERDTRDYALRERQFERSGETDAQKAMRDVLGPDATPERKSAFMRDYYLSKTEGDWQLTKLPHPTIPGDEITVERNKRTGATRLPQYPGSTGTAAAPADPFTAGIGQPVYGSDGSYSAPAAPPAAASQTTPSIPSSPGTAAPAGYRWGDVNPQTGRRELVPIEGGPATKLPEGAASKLAMLEAAKPGLEEAKKYFLDPKPLHLREGGDQAGGALYSMGKQYLGEKTGSFEIGRQRRNIRYGIEAALRAATGAAAPESEVERYTDMYAPSITDGYATRKQKIEALDRFITTYEEAATRGHGGKPASKPATPSAGGARRYNPETGKIE